MSWKKGIASLLVLLVFFLISAGMVVAGQVFSDVSDSHWAVKDIARMKSKGVIGGVSATEFAPKNPVTREQLAVMLVRVMNKQAEAGGSIPANYVYRNSVSNYAVGSIAYAVNNEIITGNLLHSDPKGAAPRHEVAVLVGRAMGLANEATQKQYATLNYKDADIIPTSSRGYVAVLQEKGIMGGSSDGNFYPNDSLTREQFASVLNRVDNYLQRLTDKAVQGKVHALSSNSISIADALGATSTVSLAADAVIFKDGKMVRLTDLGAGKMVEIIKNANNSATYIEQGDFQFRQDAMHAEIANVIIGQTVTVIILKKENGTEDTYTLGSNAVIKIAGETVAATALSVGQQVVIEASGNVISSLEVSSAQRVVSGHIKSIDLTANMIKVTGTDGTEVVLSVDSNTKIFLANSEAKLADLIDGQEVVIIALGLKATRIDARNIEKTVSGTLVRVSFSPEVTITILNSATATEETYLVGDDAIIRRDSVSGLTLRDIYPGDEVDIDLKNKVANRIYAFKVESKAKGTVDQIIIATTPTIVITTDEGKEERYPVASNAVIRKDGVTIKITEISVGDWVEMEIEGQLAVKVNVETKLISRYVIGSITNIHKSAQVLVIREIDTRLEKQVFWNSSTSVISYNRIRDINYLSLDDEVIITGRYEGGLFWATMVVIVNN